MIRTRRESRRGGPLRCREYIADRDMVPRISMHPFLPFPAHADLGCEREHGGGEEERSTPWLTVRKPSALREDGRSNACGAGYPLKGFHSRCGGNALMIF
jgi:hypothetical protein